MHCHTDSTRDIHKQYGPQNFILASEEIIDCRRVTIAFRGLGMQVNTT